jgi:hypothetical protein
MASTRFVSHPTWENLVGVQRRCMPVVSRRRPSPSARSRVGTTRAASGPVWRQYFRALRPVAGGLPTLLQGRFARMLGWLTVGPMGLAAVALLAGGAGR